MHFKTKDDPDTEHIVQEIHINNVEIYAPNASTIINNYYGNRKTFKPEDHAAVRHADSATRREEILHYVDNLTPYVAPAWKNRYRSLWHSVLDLPQVAASVYEPGKQKDTAFNRNLVANIVYVMCCHHVFDETNATTLTIALEKNKEHAVRAQLRSFPDDQDIVESVKALL